jgi:hypothetical protein
MSAKSFPPTAELTALWYRALEEEFGLAITVTEPSMINDLYASRSITGDPRLETLMLTQMKDGSMWIVKKEVRIEELPNASSLP